MRVVTPAAVVMTILALTLPPAAGVYTHATWDRDEVDLGEEPEQVVEAHIILRTQCFTLLPHPAAVTLATSATGVQFFLEGEEIRQLDLVEFQWEFSPIPVPHLFVDETLEIKVKRDKNVTREIDTLQRWLHYGISYSLDSCPAFESWTVQSILHGDNVREYIRFTAGSLEDPQP